LCPAFIGLGLLIRGGLSIPTEPGVLGAFVQEIKAGSVAAQLLGELKPGMTCYGHNTVAVQKPLIIGFSSNHLAETQILTVKI